MLDRGFHRLPGRPVDWIRSVHRGVAVGDQPVRQDHPTRADALLLLQLVCEGQDQGRDGEDLSHLELKPGGEEIEVTNENKREYVE